MNNESWRAAWEVYEAAAELPAGQRQQFVESACAGQDLANPDLANMVLKMLARLDAPDEINAVPAPPMATGGEWPHLGKSFGRFKITGPLGRGGMGEVYSALDTDLNRPVALKFLALGSVGSAGTLERSIHEAQAASALNHPGIITVHEVVRTDDSVAIVMELVEGEPLRNRCGAPQPVEQVCGWGRQIAQALAVAHARGLVHGDIKPENLMLRPDGLVKVLDFGLSRKMDSANPDLNTTLPAGTLRYMSPEQTRGEAATAASDIFSLGIVLDELATGAHPFAAETPLETAHAIAAGERKQAPAKPGAGRQFDRLMEAILDRDAAARPNAGTVAERLGKIRAAAPRRTAIWVAAAAIAVACAAGILLWNRPGTEQIAPRIVPLTNYEGSETEPAFSPDGARIAFAWTGETGIDRDVYIKDVAGGDPVRITPGGANYYAPAWSPDGKRIALLRGVRGFSQDVLIVPLQGDTGGAGLLEGEGKGAASVVSRSLKGGEPCVIGRIADTQGYKRAVGWWPDGQSLLVRNATPEGIRLVRLFPSGAPPEPMTAPPRYEEDSMVTPSPDGARLAFARLTSQKAAICLLRADGKPQDGSRDPCIYRPSSIAGLAWQPDGKGLLYADGSALWRLALSGDRVKRVTRLLEGSFPGLAGDPRNQRLAFTRTYSDMNLWRMDRDGRNAQKIASSSAEDSEAQFSPDGKKFVFRSLRTGAYELFVANRDGSHIAQITSLGGHLGSAQWSPDGNSIVFGGNRFTTGPYKDSHNSNIYVTPAAGGSVRRLTDDRASAMVPSFSRDARWIYYSSSGDGRIDLWRVPSEGGALVKLNEGPMFEVIESEDGRYFYYTKPYRADGIWRRPVRGGEETLLPGTEGLRDRHWEYHREGIYFVDGRSQLMVRFFSFATGRVTPVAPFPPHVAIGPRAITVSPDGKTIVYCQEDLTLSDIMLLAW